MTDYKKLAYNKKRRDQRKSYNEKQNQIEKEKKMQEEFIKRSGK